MIGFLVITTALSGKSKTEINFKKSVENLDSQRELMKILNSPVEVDTLKGIPKEGTRTSNEASEEKMNVKELIKLEFSDKDKYEDILNSEIKKVLEIFEYEEAGIKEGFLKHVAFAITIYSFKEDKKFIENHIEANKFYFNSCIGKPQCRDLAGVYVPVSDSEIVYIVLWASEGAK